MPLYEFVCDTCGQPFEELLLSSSPTAIAEVICPDCGSTEVHKKVSKFASRISGSSLGSFSSSSASCSPAGT